MTRINTGRVVLGGLAAGLVFNIVDAVINGLILTADFADNATRLGLDPAAMEAPAAIAAWVVVDFLLGLLAVWTYAAMRPRFGPGPKTAILAAFPLFSAITLILFGFHVMGIFTAAVFIKGTLCSGANMAIGTLAGACVYKES
jgi:hypothetical protein